ncbi:hypothetical protein ACFL1E_07950, partial [Candidatus Omnitrophota bacterium]
MRRNRLTRFLGIFFIIVVIVPSVVLAWLAMRSTLYEEAYIEKRLETALQAEVTQAVSAVNVELDLIRNELNNVDIISPDSDAEAVLSKWKQRTSLVETPFLLSSTYEMIWPATDKSLEAKEQEFVAQQQAFLGNQVTIPVYENIAIAYKDDILQGTAQTRRDPFRIPTSLQTQETTSVPISKIVAGASSKDSQALKYKSASASRREAQQWSQGEQYSAQQSVSAFTRSEPLRKKVYEQAAQEGQQILYRNIAPSKKLAKSGKFSKSLKPATSSQDATIPIVMLTA